MSLAFSLFFFEAQTVNKYFISKKPLYTKNEIRIPSKNKQKLMYVFLFGWFVVQVALPLRHHFIPNDVLWTEEGHRLSWRMMLRSKHGITSFTAVDKTSGKEFKLNTKDYLTQRQHKVMSKPDCIWQLAQRIQKEYALKGLDVAVFADTKISVNARPYYRLIDSDVDLASVKFDYFKPNSWVLPKPKEF